jgi:pimeloyl-ACP methyl ester carboxylesterase
MPKDWIVYPGADPSAFPVVVALPGLGETATTFPPALFAPLQAHGLTCVAVTYGPASVKSVPAMAADTWAGIRSLFGDIPVPVVLMGWSLGGFVAQTMTRNNPGPDVVVGVVLAATGCGKISTMLKGMRLKSIPKPPQMGKMLFDPAWFEQALSIFRMDVPCAPLKVPVLIVHGDDDGVLPLHNAQTLYAANDPQATLLVLPGVPHGVFSVDPALVGAKIQQWIHSPMKPVL